MSRKPNPRSIPCTQQDVDRAFDKGCDLGMEMGLNLVLYVLKDKHAAPDDDILLLRNEFMSVIECLNGGYLSYPDIKRALKTDYDLYVELI